MVKFEFSGSTFYINKERIIDIQRIENGKAIIRWQTTNMSCTEKVIDAKTLTYEPYPFVAIPEEAMNENA